MADAVIFDCDGVLVDSEVLSAQVEAELFAEHGLNIGVEEIYAHFVGLSKESMTALLRQNWGVELPEVYFSTRRDRVAQRFAAEGRAVPGIEGALTVLAGQGVPMAVASSSTPGSIARKLSVTGLDGFFGNHVYAAAMVTNGKPAPDLFLYAAAQLGVDPVDCVVVEDAVPGVQAGRAAGMHVIGFTAAGHCGPDHAAMLSAAGAHTVTARGPELTTALTNALTTTVAGDRRRSG